MENEFSVRGGVVGGSRVGRQSSRVPVVASADFHLKEMSGSAGRVGCLPAQLLHEFVELGRRLGVGEDGLLVFLVLAHIDHGHLKSGDWTGTGTNGTLCTSREQVWSRCLRSRLKLAGTSATFWAKPRLDENDLHSRSLEGGCGGVSFLGASKGAGCRRLFSMSLTHGPMSTGHGFLFSCSWGRSSKGSSMAPRMPTESLPKVARSPRGRQCPTSSASLLGLLLQPAVDVLLLPSLRDVRLHDPAVSAHHRPTRHLALGVLVHPGSSIPSFPEMERAYVMMELIFWTKTVFSGLWRALLAATSMEFQRETLNPGRGNWPDMVTRAPKWDGRVMADSRLGKQARVDKGRRKAPAYLPIVSAYRRGCPG